MTPLLQREIEMIVRGGDGKPKGEIVDAPKGAPADIVMNRHNRRKLMAEKMPRAARVAHKRGKHG